MAKLTMRSARSHLKGLTLIGAYALALKVLAQGKSTLGLDSKRLLFTVFLMYTHSVIAQNIKTLPITFDTNQTATIEFTQSADQATLFTVSHQGNENTISLTSPINKQLISNNSDFLFQNTIFISGEICQQCQLTINKAETSNPASTPSFAAQIETFSALEQDRIWAETVFQTRSNNGFDKNLFNQHLDDYNRAIEILARQTDRQSVLRNCRHQYIKAEMSGSMTELIEATERCIDIANTIGAWQSSFYMQIDLIKYTLWFKDKDEEALIALKENHKAISKRLSDSKNLNKIKLLLGRNLLQQGMNYAKRGNYTQATSALNEASVHFSDIGALYNYTETLLELGTTHRFQNHYTAAAKYFEAANLSNQKSHVTEKHQELRIRYNMAIVCALNGLYYLALKLAEAIENNSYPKSTIWQAHVYALKARILLELNRLDEAESLYQKAWPLYEEIGAKSHLGTLANNLSRLHSKRGNIEKAQQFTEQAVNWSGSSWGLNHKIRIQQSQVNHHLQNKEYELALGLLLNTEQQLSSADDPYRLGRVLSQKSETLIFLERYQDALETLTNAKLFHELAGDHLYTVKSDYLLAKAYFQAGQTTPLVRSHLESAKSLIESIRSTFLDDRIRQEYFALQKELFELSIQTTLRNQSPSATLDSLYEAESFKSRTLFESMVLSGNQNDSDHSNKISFDFLRASFTAVHAHPEESPPLPKLSKQALEKHRQAMPEKQAILYYFLGETQSYAWLIDNSEIKLFMLPGASHIEHKTNQLVSLLNKDPSAGNPQTLWKKIISADTAISELLLAPIADKLAAVTHLTVVPDGVLHRLPFATLLSPIGDYKKTINQSISISYANSIATVDYLKGKQVAPRDSKGLLMIANPFATDNSNNNDQAIRNNEFSSLPASELEANRLLGLWGTENNSKLLLGSAANKENIHLSSPEDFEVIHFASHAFVDWNNPANSAIKLAPSNGNREFDNADLTLANISTMKLNAELVVLSACETATGKLTTGEGPIGLSRAFFEAGANRVLASLWPVNDRATAKLLELFYQALLNSKQNPDEALTTAQQQMMRIPDYAHPYYWSGFIFVGNNQAWSKSS